MGRRALTLLTIVLGTALLAACDLSTGPRACESDVKISIVEGAPVRVAWAPACTVGSVTWDEVDSAGRTTAVVWIVSSGANEIGSSVAFGSRGEVKQQLGVGRRYRVRVGVIVGGDAIYTLGDVQFTYWPPDQPK
jgi:hypothetical protein